MGLTPKKQGLLKSVVDALKDVRGVKAIALGGSHARGTHVVSSDLDVGLYYREAEPFPIADIRRIAANLSATGSPTVTGFYEWGPFVNGGAWIDNSVCKVDFLYRNLDQLGRVIREAEAGTWSHSFDQQPPFGFRSVTLLGEIHCCEPLYDPENVLAPLKASVAVFPPALKARIVQDCVWLAEFSFDFADNFAKSRDVPNTVACMTRIFHYLVQALYALNETYFMNDKRDLEEIERFAQKPDGFGARVSALLAAPGNDSRALSASLTQLRTVFDETAAIAGKSYAPRFPLR